MTLSKMRSFPALIMCAAMLSACGSDSTGPGGVDANAALQSLEIGLRTIPGVPSATIPQANASFDGIGPVLNQVAVNIDGASQEMFALGLKESVPPGTCEETLFETPAPPPSVICTPPQFGLAVILWQAHSASQAPDRMIFIVADEGTMDFDFTSVLSGQSFAIALYVDGANSTWISNSGTLTSQTTATTQTCNIPLPPYAKSGVCNIAMFNEQGSIIFEPVSLNLPSAQRKSIAIPAMSLHGVWVAITEVQPLPATPNLLVPGKSVEAGALASRVLAARILALN